ncbi:MAG TPA: hypothetical protein VN688_15170 [Gemmataceae bacterium]|nr:hypothetical protein [Gemmataceae bacterium]
MIANSSDRFWLRVRGLCTSVLLLLLPACGLSDYEALMLKAQEREQRFRLENKELDEPVQAPKLKDNDGKEKSLNLFFRPPRGIQSTPEPSPLGGLLWRYRNRTSGDFAYVEMAFAEDSKDFAAEVLRNYQATEQARVRAQEFTPPGRDTPLIYDIWEFDNGSEGYAINISRTGRTRVAIVFVFGRGRWDALRKVMDLSLESLAVDQQAGAARQKYGRKSPWQLQNTRAP